MGLIQEFKTFAVKGNAIDLAVGIIIGAAFTKIVNSLVNDIIMPPVGMLVGGKDFSKLMIVLEEEVKDDKGTIIQPLTAIRYGLFLNNVLDFLIVAFCVFMIVRTLNRMIAQREALTAVLIKKKTDELEAQKKA